MGDIVMIANIIAIDGPAASGKSTLGKKLAESLGYMFFDTGIMYRAITWAALTQKIDLNDGNAVSRLAETVEIDIQPPSREDGRSSDVWINGQDITWEIRQPEVDANVSVVSAYSRVRQALTRQQRRIGQRGRVVMVGRDIGTVVLPDADLKIYLEASPEERAHRRWIEMRQRGEPAVLEEILDKVRSRDKFDSTRAIAPMRPAEDAVILQSDGLDIEQVLEKAKALVFERDCC